LSAHDDLELDAAILRACSAQLGVAA